MTTKLVWRNGTSDAGAKWDIDNIHDKTKSVYIDLIYIYLKKDWEEITQQITMNVNVKKVSLLCLVAILWYLNEKLAIWVERFKLNSNFIVLFKQNWLCLYCFLNAAISNVNFSMNIITLVSTRLKKAMNVTYPNSFEISLTIPMLLKTYIWLIFPL